MPTTVRIKPASRPSHGLRRGAMASMANEATARANPKTMRNQATRLLTPAGPLPQYPPRPAFQLLPRRPLRRVSAHNSTAVTGSATRPVTAEERVADLVAKTWAGTVAAGPSGTAAHHGVSRISRTVASSCLTLIGLPWKPSNPAAMIRVRSWVITEAVIAITGVELVTGSARSCCRA